MSLEEIVTDPELERPGYHLLPGAELDSRNDAEAIFEKGRRLRLGLDGKPKQDEVGLDFYVQSARMGHAVAKACCYYFGRETAGPNFQQAAKYFLESAKRGHPVGRL